MTSIDRLFYGILKLRIGRMGRDYRMAYIATAFGTFGMNAARDLWPVVDFIVLSASLALVIGGLWKFISAAQYEREAIDMLMEKAPLDQEP